jgi:hypothetical protein
MSHVKSHAPLHGGHLLTKQKPSNMAASVRERLLKRSRKTGEDFQLLLTRFGIERLLARLAASRVGDQFTLKGALLFLVWSKMPHRPTRDIDLLGTGECSPDYLATVFREIMTTDVEEDGLVFDPNSIVAALIKEAQEYEGVRITADAKLENARIRIRVDIGFGDAITPAPVTIEFPSLLDFVSPRLKAYPKETVVAEKFQAMVVLGMANSRMKDFYDLWTLALLYEFGFDELFQAIRNTFQRRKTSLPTKPPVALTDEFATNQKKTTDWFAFLKRSNLSHGAQSLTKVTGFLKEFLQPVFEQTGQSPKQWKPGGPWECT